MPKQTLVVHNKSGLHARPAALFVKTARGFANTTIQISKDGLTHDAKSILGVLTLAISQGSSVTIQTEGDEADAALATLVEAIESGLGE